MYNRYITDVLKYRFIYLKSLVFLLLSSLKKRLIHFCTVSPPILSQRIELTIPCADPEQFFQPGGGVVVRRLFEFARRGVGARHIFGNFIM